MVEFFKNVPYFQFMSTVALIRMEHLFKLQSFDLGGKVIFKEGEPVKQIAIIKDGEFEIFKRDLYDVDAAIIRFLQDSAVRSKMAKQILLLRGGNSIYSKSKQLFPAFKRNEEQKSMMRKQEAQSEEDAAFESVSDQLIDIVKRYQEPPASLNTIKTSNLYKP